MLAYRIHTHTHKCKPVEEDAANIIMVDGGFLGTGSHPQRSEETVDQDVELVDIPVITHGQTETYLTSNVGMWIQ